MLTSEEEKWIKDISQKLDTVLEKLDRPNIERGYIVPCICPPFQWEPYSITPVPYYRCMSSFEVSIPKVNQLF